MQSFFQMAIAFLVMISFVNGMLFVFGEPVAGIEFYYPASDSISITEEEVQDTTKTSENTAKEGDPFAAIYSFVSLLVGTVTGAVGGVALLLGPFFAFGNAWSFALKTIFGNSGLMWDFLTWTVIPFVNLMQVGAVTYVVLYAVSAVRGGSV